MNVASMLCSCTAQAALSISELPMFHHCHTDTAFVHHPAE